MKAEVILIQIFTFINFSFCDDFCSVKLTGVSTKSDCSGLSLTSAEKKLGADSCCYVSYKENGDDVKYCTALPEDQSDLYKESLKDDETTDIVVECNSKWLNFSMFLIGLFALLF